MLILLPTDQELLFEPELPRRGWLVGILLSFREVGV